LVSNYIGQYKRYYARKVKKNGWHMFDGRKIHREIIKELVAKILNFDKDIFI
jgi:hypothetical protein